MKINIIGAGYVGLTCAAYLSQFDNKITLSDKDSNKIQQLKNKSFLCSESHIMPLLEKAKIIYQENYCENQDIYLICVGTPNKNNIPDFSQIESVIDDLSKVISPQSIIILKSTILPGTTKKFKKLIESKISFEINVYFIPEFLSEGNAFNDYTNAEKIIVGNHKKNCAIIKEFLNFHQTDNFYFCNYETAELAKYANNIMLASRLATMNQISLVADKVGANILEIESIVGMDSRIGPKYLKTGVGFGGSCLEKDLTALNFISSQNNSSSLFSSILKNNAYQTKYFSDKIITNTDKNKLIALIGLTFKAGTDDCRNSCSVDILAHLLTAGYSVNIQDDILKTSGIISKFISEFKRKYPHINTENINIFEDIYSGLKNTGGFILGQLHLKDHQTLNFTQIKSQMIDLKVFDGNKFLSRKYVENLGFEYYSIGA